MPLFSRRPSLPAPIRAQLTLPPGDRVLVATELVGGGWAAATRRALYVVDPTLERRPWADVDRATLDAETSTLTVRWVTGTSQALALTGAGAPPFAQVLRERVQSSVVHSETVPVKGAGEIRVALRRDEDGELVSQVIGDGTTDLSDPAVAALVDAAERRVRAAAGLAG
ncbi:hypothetical protein [Cellulomonas sp. NS3]|uniref:hypothetical protein n=1 Tax=Cellulomonas sp. NS3 TaxID=2973977 RepID=UPI0021639B96|nr:hypothetical protein [Cellulomonas sp. NS3]